MIGGNDIVIPAVGDPATLEACVRIIQRRWPHARFEDIISGRKYSSYLDIPFGLVRHVLAYPDAEAEAAWDSDSPDSPPNSMLHLILSPNDITAVVDEPNTAEMRSMLDSIRLLLGHRLLETKIADALPEAA
jgi:hypothetical protein